MMPLTAVITYTILNQFFFVKLTGLIRFFFSTRVQESQ